MDRIYNYSFTKLMMVVFILNGYHVLSQVSPAKQIVITETPVLITADLLNNIYVIDSVGQLLKFNSKGNKTGSFGIWEYGKIRHVDVINPQKLLAYYPQFNKAVVLDQSLSSQYLYNLEELNLWNVGALGLSNDNNLWIYDKAENRILKISKTGARMVETEPIYFVFDGLFKPYRLAERNNHVYLMDKKKGVLVFDLFGRYVDHWPIAHEWIEIYNNGKLFYKKDDQIWYWRPGTLPELMSFEDGKIPALVTPESMVTIKELAK